MEALQDVVWTRRCPSSQTTHRPLSVGRSVGRSRLCGILCCVAMLCCCREGQHSSNTQHTDPHSTSRRHPPRQHAHSDRGTVADWRSDRDSHPSQCLRALAGVRDRQPDFLQHRRRPVSASCNAKAAETLDCDAKAATTRLAMRRQQQRPRHGASTSDGPMGRGPSETAEQQQQQRHPQRTGGGGGGAATDL